MSIERSTFAWAALEGDRPLAVFGVGGHGLLADVGCPWFLGAEGVEQHPRAMLELGRRWLVETLAHFRLLENHVDDRYDAAKRWLVRLGFTLEPPAPFGVSGLPFCKFTMERG